MRGWLAIFMQDDKRTEVVTGGCAGVRRVTRGQEEASTVLGGCQKVKNSSTPIHVKCRTALSRRAIHSRVTPRQTDHVGDTWFLG
jgi:hypothetical protein